MRYMSDYKGCHIMGIYIAACNNTQNLLRILSILDYDIVHSVRRSYCTS